MAEGTATDPTRQAGEKNRTVNRARKKVRPIVRDK